MKTSIGLTDQERQELANVLCKTLADEFVFFNKLLNAHWNVEGADFHAAHSYLDELYHEQLETVDEVAEFIRILGHYVPAKLAKYQELTHLTEAYEGKNNSHDYYADLLATLDSMIMNIRGNIELIDDKYKAVATADFLTSLIEKHMKTAWMLRAHLK